MNPTALMCIGIALILGKQCREDGENGDWLGLLSTGLVGICLLYTAWISK